MSGIQQMLTGGTYKPVFSGFTLSQTLTNPASLNGTWFGWDISFDSTASKLLISAVNQTTSANPKGAVYTYSRATTTFSNVGVVYGTTAHSYEFGRGTSLSADGTVFSVSNGGGGAVNDKEYVYAWPSTQSASSSAAGGTEEATFCFTPSSYSSGYASTANATTPLLLNTLTGTGVSGSFLLNHVGYPLKNIKSYPTNAIPITGYSGSTYCDIYNVSTSTGAWTYSTFVQSGNGVPFVGGSCCAMSADGNYLFVAYTKTNTGYLQMFQKTGATYTYVTTISQSTRSRYGISVATNYDGSIVAVGDDSSSVSTQAVFVYSRSGSSLNLLQTISSPGASVDRFGFTIAMNNNASASSYYLAIADAFTTNSGTPNSGTVYIYKG
jgi:hypothetical protein